MTRGIAVAVAALFWLSVSADAQGPRRDGRWAVTVEMNMPGMPAGMPPMAIEQCVTKEEAENPETLMPRGPGGPGMQGNCKVSDQKTEGNKVSWSMSCSAPQEMTGTGEFTYAGDTFEGVMHMLMQGQAMTMKYAGKRLGDCVK